MMGKAAAQNTLINGLSVVRARAGLNGVTNGTNILIQRVTG